MAKSDIARERLCEIEELAEIVADEYCPQGRVHPDEIAHAVGVTLNFGRYQDYFDGLLEHLSGRFHIYCNLDRVDNPQSGRAHFTLAHELGHYFIDEHRNALAAGVVPSHPSFSEYESPLLVESEADHFASNLLMPEQRFRLACKTKRVGMASILEMSSVFGTSVTSTALRYVKLDIVPCAVFKWANAKLQWHWMSTDTFRAKFGSAVRREEELPSDSPTARALRGEGLATGQWLEAGTTVSAWFHNVSEHGRRNDILIEQAIPLGRFGVLSFIYPEEGQYSF
jgi:Zn-dependent peptidase ImmA (M78 family)